MRGLAGAALMAASSTHQNAMDLLGFCFLEFFPQLKPEGRIFSYAVSEQTFGAEEHDHAAVPIHESACVLRPIDTSQNVEIAAHPACQRKGHPFDEGLDPVLGLEARRDDIKLEFTYGSQDRLPAHMIGGIKHLHDPFFFELLEAFLELFLFREILASEDTKALRGKLRNGI